MWRCLMFKTSCSWLNYFLNFVIAVLLFFLLRSWGWITVTSDLPLWAVVLIGSFMNILTGLIVGLAVFAISVIWASIEACSFMLLMPILIALASYFVYRLTGMWTGLYSVTTVWWQAIVFGLLFSLLHFSKKGK